MVGDDESLSVLPFVLLLARLVGECWLVACCFSNSLFRSRADVVDPNDVVGDAGGGVCVDVEVSVDDCLGSEEGNPTVASTMAEEITCLVGGMGRGLRRTSLSRNTWAFSCSYPSGSISKPYQNFKRRRTF